MYNILFGGRRKKFEVNCAETTYKVHYLGNVMTSLLKSGGGGGGGAFDSTSLSSSKRISTPPRSLGGICTDTNNNNTGRGVVDEDDHDDVLDFNDHEDDEEDDDYEDTACLERIASAVAADDQLELVSCVDKPVRILWDNHLKNSGL